MKNEKIIAVILTFFIVITAIILLNKNVSITSYIVFSPEKELDINSTIISDEEIPLNISNVSSLMISGRHKAEGSIEVFLKTLDEEFLVYSWNPYPKGDYGIYTFKKNYAVGENIEVEVIPNEVEHTLYLYGEEVEVINDSFSINEVGDYTIKALFNDSGEIYEASIDISVEEEPRLYIDLEDECEESCNLPKIKAENLVIKVRDSEIYIDKIKYTQKIENNPPILIKNIPDINLSDREIINLSEYFVDPDKDRLFFDITNIIGVTEEIRDNLLILEKNEVVNEENATARIYANDLSAMTESNEFTIYFVGGINDIKEDILVKEGEKREIQNAEINANNVIVEGGGELILDGVTLISENTEFKEGAKIIIRNSKHTVIQNSNLTISGANYVLDNSILVMNASYDGHIGITVENGGNITIMNNSSITNGADYGGNESANYFFKIMGGAEPGGINLSDSVIEHVGFIGETSNRGIYIAGRVIEIENSTIRNSYRGILLENVENISIDNNMFYNNTGYSISLSNVNNSNITNNYIDSMYGISIYGSKNNLVNNTIKTNYDSIAVSSNSENNIISHNKIKNSGYSARIFIMGADTQILYNEINATGSGAGIYLGSNNTTISYNNITATNFSGIGIGISDNANNSFIENNRIIARGAESGIYIYFNNSNSKTIKNNYFSGGRYAIYVERNTKNLILDNNIFENFDEGSPYGDSCVFFYNQNQYTSVTENILIVNNTFNNISNVGGILFRGSSVTYKNITIIDNDFVDVNGSYGAVYFTNVYSSEDILIYNNYFDNVMYGPWVEGEITKNISINNNWIEDTTYTATGIITYNTSEREAKNLEIKNNIIYRDTSDFGAISLWQRAENQTIDNNTIRDSKYGIFFYAPNPSSFKNINITNNKIYNSLAGGITINNGENIVLEDNIVEGNSNSEGVNIINSKDIMYKNTNITETENGIKIIENSQRVNITDSLINLEGTGTRGMYINNSSEITISHNNITAIDTIISLSRSNNVFIMNNSLFRKIGALTNPAIVISNVYNNRIENNYMNITDDVIDTTNMDFSNITNNTIYFRCDNSTECIGIWLKTGSDNNIVKYNALYDGEVGIASPQSNNNTIEWNNITNYQTIGIAFRGGGGHIVRNNRLINTEPNSLSSWPSLLVGHTSSPGPSNYNIIENNTIVRNDYQGGIETAGDNNIIKDNTISEVNKYGINVLPGTENLTIQNNTISDSNATGIIINGATNNKIINNIITDMKSIDTGIVLNNTRNNNITGNNISNNLGDGLKLINATATITENIINNNTYSGIANYNLSIEDTATNITNNTICDNGLYAIWQENARCVNAPEELNATNNFCDSSNYEGRVKQRWYVQVRVIDVVKNVPEANVSIYEPYTNTTPKYSAITDMSGLTPENISVEYNIDSDGNTTFLTPHRIIGEKGLFYKEENVTINESRLASLGNEIILNIEPCECLAKPNEVCELHNKTCIVYYNVTRDNDTIIDNTTIYVNASYNGEFGLNFTSGRVIITNNSMITNGKDIGGNESAKYFFISSSDTEVEITNSSVSDSYSMNIYSDNAYIVDNNITYTINGIRIFGNNVRVYRNNVMNYSSTAIRVNGNYSDIFNNSIQDGAFSSIGIKIDGYPVYINNNRIFYNRIFSGYRGIESIGASNNIISYNIINNINETAIILKDSHYNNITENIIMNNLGGGISINISSSNIINNNILTNNSYNIYLFGDVFVIPRRPPEVSYVYSEYNQIINNTIREGERGIHLYLARDNEIINNIVKNHSYAGIFINTEDENNIVRNNTIRENNIGVEISGGEGVINNSVYHNLFINNTIQAIDNTSIGSNNWNISVDGVAQGNYWSDIFTNNLNIEDSNSDGWGDSGDDYPYNETNGGNVLGEVNDWGPMLINNTPPTIIITRPNNGADFQSGSSIRFSATAIDAEDGILSGDSITWTSNIEGVFGTGNDFTTSNIDVVGTHIITATAKDIQGLRDSDSINLIITKSGGVTPPSGGEVGGGAAPGSGRIFEFIPQETPPQKTLELSPGELSIEKIKINNEVLFKDNNWISNKVEVGKEIQIIIIVKNLGQKPLHNVHLELKTPQGLKLEKITPENKPILEGRESETFKAWLLAEESRALEIIVKVVSDEQIKTEKFMIERTERKEEEIASKVRTKHNILLVFAVTLVVAFALMIYETTRKKKLNPKLVEYIEKCRFMEMKDEEIKDELLKSGWEEEEVERHLMAGK